ncbi:MAG: hypothetical protein NXY59_01955 [Aigarchaeota archaeon]|nr:hypothetical protein [Candidatus Pelearchaeum maunauluense]
MIILLIPISYVRGSKYGENMGNELAVKINAPLLLSKELTRLAARNKYGIIAIGTATEPWMKIEEKYKITRACLEMIAKHRFPVHCLTKSPIILRDLDLLREIDEYAILPYNLKEQLNHRSMITISLSTLDDSVAAIFEPGAPKPTDRLKLLGKIKDAGIYAGIAYILYYHSSQILMNS